MALLPGAFRSSTLLIAANFAVFLFYELPNPAAAVSQAAFYPCDVNNACHMGGRPWGLGWIAVVLGAYYVLYPNSRGLTLVLWFPVRIPAWLFLGVWFLYQFFEGNNSLIHPATTGGSGVAFFAHVGGFVFGVIAARVLIAIGPNAVNPGAAVQSGYLTTPAIWRKRLSTGLD